MVRCHNHQSLTDVYCVQYRLYLRNFYYLIFHQSSVSGNSYLNCSLKCQSLGKSSRCSTVVICLKSFTNQYSYCFLLFLWICLKTPIWIFPNTHMVNPGALNEQEKSAAGLLSLLQQLQSTHCHLFQALNRFTRLE